MARYTKGDRITDPIEALSHILDGDVIFWNHKAQNAAWMSGMTLRAIVGGVRNGIIYRAVDTQEQLP